MLTNRHRLSIWGQCRQQRVGRLQVWCLKSFGEPRMHRREVRTRIIAQTLP